MQGSGKATGSHRYLFGGSGSKKNSYSEKKRNQKSGEIFLHIKCRDVQNIGWYTKIYHFAWRNFYLYPFELLEFSMFFVTETLVRVPASIIAPLCRG